MWRSAVAERVLAYSQALNHPAIISAGAGGYGSSRMSSRMRSAVRRAEMRAVGKPVPGWVLAPTK